MRLTSVRAAELSPISRVGSDVMGWESLYPPTDLWFVEAAYVCQESNK